MTKAQRITLMADWWPSACRAQGWDANDRAKRMAVLSAAVVRPLESASQLNSTDDIDAVKAHLGMLADNLQAARETIEPEIGRARRLRITIGEQLRCLALYVDGQESAQAYLAELIKDKLRHGATVMPVTIDDLTATPKFYKDRAGKDREIPSQLDQVVMTLARNIQAKRAAAGDTVHGMKIKAGVRCDCTICCKKRMMAQIPPLEKILDPENEPW